MSQSAGFVLLQSSAWWSCHLAWNAVTTSPLKIEGDSGALRAFLAYFDGDLTRK